MATWKLFTENYRAVYEMQNKFKLLTKGIFLIFVIMFFVFSSVFLISGQVPELHVVQGFVYNINGATQVPSGTVVIVNATATGSVVTVLTSGPPNNGGFYSTEISASDGELVRVMAYNATRYGINSSVLLNSPSTTRINMVLNTTRPPELDTTIILPSNDSLFDRFDSFNLTFNVSAIGGQDSLNCNATLVIGNQQIVNVTSGGVFTKNLGNISLGSNVSSYFELEAIFGGTTALTVVSSCLSDGENFENLYSDSIAVRVAQQPPQLHAVQGYILLSDNVTQAASGTAVTLTASQTGSVVNVQTSGPPGHSGFYSTVINAQDGEAITVRAQNDTYFGVEIGMILASPSTTRINVTLDEEITYPPYFNFTVVDDDFNFPENEIDLSAAGTKLVSCWGNVSDEDGFEDIVNVSAVFYDGSETNASSEDDGNNHYTNSSCALSSCSGLSCVFNCSFSVQYYANSNVDEEWLCVLNGTDFAGTSGYANDSVSVNPLLAIGFPDFLNYGTVGPGEVSDETVGNVTNMGNVQISISVEGYGFSQGDGDAMICDDGTNVSVGFEKYNLTASNPGAMSLSVFESFYTNVSSSPVNETDFVLDYRKNESFNEATNETYWRIYLPVGIPSWAQCSGFVDIGVLQAV